MRITESERRERRNIYRRACSAKGCFYSFFPSKCIFIGSLSSFCTFPLLVYLLCQGGRYYLFTVCVFRCVHVQSGIFMSSYCALNPSWSPAMKWVQSELPLPPVNGANSVLNPFSLHSHLFVHFLLPTNHLHVHSLSFCVLALLFSIFLSILQFPSPLLARW